MKFTPSTLEKMEKIVDEAADALMDSGEIASIKLSLQHSAYLFLLNGNLAGAKQAALHASRLDPETAASRQSFLSKLTSRSILFCMAIKAAQEPLPEEQDGEFTGKVSGLPSFKEGKVTRLEAWLKNKNLSLADFKKSYFYSDSHNDLPLMQKVTHPIAVDADDILTEYAKSKGWPLISLIRSRADQKQC